MMTLVIRRLAPLAALLTLSALVVRVNSVPTERSDLWFHLRMGSEFLGGWAISAPGHLGVYDSASWVPTQWLSQVGMSWAEQQGGLGAVLWMSATLQAATLAVVYLICRRESGPLGSALATAACTWAVAAALTPRPQIASYLLFALTVAGWRSSSRTGRAPLWLIPLSWAWVPLHGMWPIALAVGFVMAFGLSFDGVLRGRQRLLAFAVPVASLVLAAASPVGPSVFSGVLGVGSRRIYFAEWAPPDFTDFRAMGVLVMGVVVLISALRSAPRKWHELLYLGTAMGLAVFSFRTVPLAAIMLAPLVAQAAQRGLPDSLVPSRREGTLLAASVVLVGAVVGITTPTGTPGPALAPWLVARLEAMPSGTRVLDEWDTGGYFLWQAPQVDLVMHGYADVFTVEELRRNVAISRVDAGWDDLVDDLDADYALVDPDSALAYGLLEHSSWDVVEADGSYMLLSPPAASTE
jgi:hypothetical protein